MSKISKFAIALGGSIVFLLVSLSLLVKVVVTPEKVRETLLPLAENYLQRKIDVGAIDIGIFSGVSFSDLRVQKKATPDDFVTVKLLALNYKILPLFSGEIVVDRVLIEEPIIHIVQTSAGVFNFSDLIPSDSENTAVKSKTIVTEDTAATSSPVFDLLVKKVSLKGGEVFFVDQSQNSKSPYRYIFEQVNLDASEITLDKAFPIVFSAVLNDSHVNLSGRYNISNQLGDFDLALSALDLVKFSPYYRELLPGKLGSAILALNLEVKLDSEIIHSKGQVKLDQLDLSLDALPEAAFQHAKLGIDYAVDYNLSKSHLAISTCLINFNDSVVGVQGEVALAGTEPVLQLDLLLDRLDLRTLFEGLPRGLTKELQRYSFAGQLDGRVSLVGAPSSGSKMLDGADFKLSGLKMSAENTRFGLDGSINYQNKVAVGDKIVVTIADQQLFVDFKAENLSSDLIRGTFKVSAKQLDLNKLLPEQSKADVVPSGRDSGRNGTPVIAEEIGPFDLPLDMTGELRVGQLIYKKMNLEQVQADLALKDNYLKISQLRAGVAGGQFDADLDVNLGVKGLQYQGQMKLDQSNLLSLVSGLVPQAQQSVSGMLQWQNNFSGRGTLPDNLLHSLQLKGLMKLQKGQISGSPLLEQLALFLNLPDLKILSFESLESQYDLRNGLANISGDLNSSKAKFKPKGTISVDGDLDLKLDARISPELMERIGVKLGLQQSFSDQDGWGMLPLAVKGSLARPRITFDAAALQKQATGKVKEEATQRLLDKIIPSGETEQEPVRKLLEGTLNKLFGN